MKLENLIWKQVRTHARLNGINQRLTSAEDLFQECYRVALEAVKQYDDKKEAALSTFVFTCVQNHLKDFVRYQEHRNSECDPVEDYEDSQEPDYFMINMKNMLGEFDFELFVLHFVENYSIREIVELKNITYHEVQKCLQHICRVYQLRVLNPIQNITSLSEKKSSRSISRGQQRRSSLAM